MNVALQIFTLACMLGCCAGIVHVARENKRLRLALDTERRARTASIDMQTMLLSRALADVDQLQSALTLNVEVVRDEG